MSKKKSPKKKTKEKPSPGEGNYNAVVINEYKSGTRSDRALIFAARFSSSALMQSQSRTVDAASLWLSE